MSGRTARAARKAAAAPAAPGRHADGQTYPELESDPDREFTVSDLAPAGVRKRFSGEEIARAQTVRREWERLARQVEYARKHLVKDARARGVSWDGVGWLIGTTGEAARQRYGTRR